MRLPRLLSGFFLLFAFICTSCRQQAEKQAPLDIMQQLLPKLLAEVPSIQSAAIGSPDPADTLDAFSSRRTRFLTHYQARYGKKIAIFIGTPEAFGGPELALTLQNMLTPRADLPPGVPFDTIPESPLVRALLDSLQQGQPFPIASLTPVDSLLTYVCCMHPDTAFAFAEVAISAIGFNPAHTEGCCYFAFYGGPMNAYGCLVFIRKTAGRWEIVKRDYCWVA